MFNYISKIDVFCSRLFLYFKFNTLFSIGVSSEYTNYLKIQNI